ncbi:Nucleolar protein NET1 [Nakaseomyces bracarensis]|uniref:Nucleolar protein NET1 n=1 Tax=Nakaseomyces bracarensis TaxID=273131 RepID=A0ABR4P101_9SACH
MYKLQVVLVQPQSRLPFGNNELENSDEHNNANNTHIIHDQTRKFLHFTKPDNTLLELADEIERRCEKLYTTLRMDSFEIQALQDSNSCDLDAEYLVKDVFAMDNTVMVMLSNELEFDDVEREVPARISGYSRRKRVLSTSSGSVEPQILVNKRSRPNNQPNTLHINTNINNGNNNNNNNNNSNTLRVSSPLANEISNDDYNASSIMMNRNISSRLASKPVAPVVRSFLPPPSQPQSPAIRISSGIGNGKRILSESNNLDVVSRSEVVDPNKSRQQLLVPDSPTSYISTPNRVVLSGQRVMSEAQPKSLVFSKNKTGNYMGHSIDLQLADELAFGSEADEDGPGVDENGVENYFSSGSSSEDNKIEASPSNYRGNMRKTSLELRVQNKRGVSTNIPIVEDVLKRIDNFSDTEEGHNTVIGPTRNSSLASRQFEVDYNTNSNGDKDSTRSIAGSEGYHIRSGKPRDILNRPIIGTSVEPPLQSVGPVINDISKLQSEDFMPEVQENVHDPLLDIKGSVRSNISANKANSNDAVERFIAASRRRTRNQAKTVPSNVEKPTPVTTPRAKGRRKETNEPKDLQAIVDKEFPDEIEREPSPISMEIKKLSSNPEMKKSVAEENPIKMSKSTNKNTAKKTTSNESLATKTPATKTSAKQPPAKQTTAKQTPVKSIPVKQTPAKQTPAKQTPAKQTPAKQAPPKVNIIKQILSKETRANETVSTKRTLKQTPSKELPAMETPSKESAVKKTPSKATTVKETLAKATAVKETLAKATAVKETLAKESAVKETPAKVSAVKHTPAKEGVVKDTPAKEIAKATPAKEIAKATPAKEIAVTATPAKESAVKETTRKGTLTKETSEKDFPTARNKDSASSGSNSKSTKSNADYSAMKENIKDTISSLTSASSPSKLHGRIINSKSSDITKPVTSTVNARTSTPQKVITSSPLKKNDSVSPPKSNEPINRTFTPIKLKSPAAKGTPKESPTSQKTKKPVKASQSKNTTDNNNSQASAKAANNQLTNLAQKYEQRGLIKKVKLVRDESSDDSSSDSSSDDDESRTFKSSQTNKPEPRSKIEQRKQSSAQSSPKKSSKEKIAKNALFLSKDSSSSSDENSSVDDSSD